MMMMMMIYDDDNNVDDDDDDGGDDLSYDGAGGNDDGYAIGVYHREGEEGGGRTKYVLTAAGLSIILPVLDRWLVATMGLFLPLLKSIVLFMTLEKNAYLLDG
jgi:hypothetical protein